MNLQEFIKTALIDIIVGVTEASAVASSHGSARIGAMRPDRGNEGATDANGFPITSVEFDIALADGTSTDSRGGIGVFLGAVGAGSQGASHGEASTHSRIKFSVPVVLPRAGG